MFSPEDLISQNNSSKTTGNDLVEDVNTTAVHKFSKLTQECVDNNLQDIGIGKKDIHTIVSYTPLYSSPPYSAKCFNLSELKKDVLHTPIHGLASSGGVATLSYLFIVFVNSFVLFLF